MRAWPEGGDDQAGLGAAVALPDRAALESDAVGDSSSDAGSPRCGRVAGMAVEDAVEDDSDEFDDQAWAVPPTSFSHQQLHAMRPEPGLGPGPEPEPGPPPGRNPVQAVLEREGQLEKLGRELKAAARPSLASATPPL